MGMIEQAMLQAIVNGTELQMHPVKVLWESDEQELTGRIYLRNRLVGAYYIDPFIEHDYIHLSDGGVRDEETMALLNYLLVLAWDKPTNYTPSIMAFPKVWKIMDREGMLQDYYNGFVFRRGDAEGSEWERYITARTAVVSGNPLTEFFTGKLDSQVLA
jgi:hypothetical protein